jgi:hypothetical protein
MDIGKIIEVGVREAPEWVPDPEKIRQALSGLAERKESAEPAPALAE